VSFWNSGRVHPSKSIFGFEQSLTPASVATNVAAEQAFTITASPSVLKSTDLVYVTPPAMGNALAVSSARINTTGQLVIVFVNTTAGALTPAAGTYKVLVARL
jgi:hypothetical protein